MIFKAALIKLMFWYMVLALAMSLVFSVVLYHFATDELNESLTRELTLIDRHTDHDEDDKITVPETVIGSHDLRAELLYFNLIVLAGSTVFSYVLARRTLKPIEIAHNAQIRFTAEASHELRTPLTAMRADSESVLLAKNKSVKLLEKTLRENLADVKHLEEVSNHLLSVARYKSKIIEVSEFDMKANAMNAVKRAERTTKKRRIKYEIAGPALRVIGDPLALQLVMATVLDNAAKYSKIDSKVKITISKSHYSCLVVVQDSGVGIARKNLPHVFDYFYSSQDRSDGRGSSQAYGLGLPLARDIMKLQHGSIEISSQVETKSGTTVSIYVPLA